MGAEFNFQVAPSGYHPSQPSLKREGVIFPPYEGGLKVGANLDFHVSPTGCHPSPTLPSFREGSIIKLLRLLSGDRMEVCRFRDMVYVKNFLFLFCL